MILYIFRAAELRIQYLLPTCYTINKINYTSTQSDKLYNIYCYITAGC